MNENWNIVPRYCGKYEASTAGRIRNIRTGVILKGCDNGQGYLFLALYSVEKRLRAEKIHRLVAEAFIPNPDNLPDVNHINGDKYDNRVENLEWVSKKRNHEHAMALGLKARGERCGLSKLSNEDVIAIRKQYANGLSEYKLAKAFCVSRGAIDAVISRRTWKHIA